MTNLGVAVIGGGIIGVAVARQFLLALPDAEVVLYEKEDRLAAHQTGHNSGVVHAGLYYPPGSLKAALCRRGVRLLRNFATESGVPYEACGKVVVARGTGEADRLHEVHRRAVANGVPDVRLIDAAELREIEPAVAGSAALHSPHTGIVNFTGLTHALAADLRARGGDVLLEREVTNLRRSGGRVQVNTAEETAVFDIAVTCAGLQSDRLARASGDPHEPAIIPFSGDYFLLRPAKRYLVRGLVYPVPDPRYPFLGVHLTKRIDGEVLVGPNAFVAPAREGYRRGQVSARDLSATLTYPGFWRFAAGNLGAAYREARTALSKQVFVTEAQSYLPELRTTDVTPGPRGVRAQAMQRDGTLVDDFVISGDDRIVHVRNAPSPGATSSLAIAEHVATQALQRAGIPSATA
jgi:L-2-hydroxyglutarate oxidase LhgO